MASLVIFKETIVNRLRSDIRDNLAHYAEEQSWLVNSAALAQWEVGTTVELKEAIELVLPSESDLRDIDNAIRLHKALSSLTPLQARDPRLWAHLAHVE